MRPQIVVAALAIVATATSAAAHHPYFGTDDYTDPETAFVIADPEISIVLYRRATCERPQLWMRFDGQAGMELYVQLLVPAIARLQAYRPTLAVVGPGFERTHTGIDLPSGTGAVVFPTASVEPVVFDEPFTGTRDWILVEETLRLPQDGTYYIVAWDPHGGTGKLAVAVGTREQFGLLDMFRFPGWRRDARAFHELERFAPDQPIVETVCPR